MIRFGLFKNQFEYMNKGKEWNVETEKKETVLADACGDCDPEKVEEL